MPDDASTRHQFQSGTRILFVSDHTCVERTEWDSSNKDLLRRSHQRGSTSIKDKMRRGASYILFAVW